VNSCGQWLSLICINYWDLDPCIACCQSLTTYTYWLHELAICCNYILCCPSNQMIITNIVNSMDKWKGTVILCDSKGDTCAGYNTLSSIQWEHLQGSVFQCCHFEVPVASPPLLGIIFLVIKFQPKYTVFRASEMQKTRMLVSKQSSVFHLFYSVPDTLQRDVYVQVKKALVWQLE